MVLFHVVAGLDNINNNIVDASTNSPVFPHLGINCRLDLTVGFILRAWRFPIDQLWSTTSANTKRFIIIYNSMTQRSNCVGSLTSKTRVIVQQQVRSEKLETLCFVAFFP